MPKRRRPAPRAFLDPLEPRTLLAAPPPVAWYTANVLALANGAAVAAWPDASGNANNATQATAARRPTYLANGIGTHPAVHFNAASSTQLAFTRPVSTDFTIAVVFRSTQGIGNQLNWFNGAGLVDGEVGGVTNDFGLSLSATGQVLGGTGQPDTTAASGLGFNDGRPHVATFTRAAATGTLALYVDGKLFQQTTGASTAALTAASRLTLGSLQTNVNYFTGDIADVRVYSAALAAADRAAVESDLESTYGIAPPAARTFTNPVVDANFPDPGVLKVGPTFYAFATNTGGRNAPVRTSSNLVNWSSPVDALPTLPSWAQTGRTWAPYAAKMADNVHYNLYFTAWSKTDNRQHVGVAQAGTPAGPYTPLGSAPFVDQASLGGAIDPSVFTDTTGTRYLVWKNDGNSIGQPTNLYVQQLSNDGLTLIGSPTNLIHNDQSWEGSVVEAPEILKHNNKYYLFYSANNYANANYCIGYAVADALLGPYTKPAGPWVKSVNTVVGPGGQSFTAGPDGNTWMLYHSWENNLAYRSMSADQLGWNGDIPVLRGPSRAQQQVPTFIRTAPTLTIARTDSSTGAHASGILASVANSTFTLQFFATPTTANAAPNYVGSALITTDSAGNARFADIPLAPVPLGQSLTVTATDPTGEPSPASAARTVRLTGDLDANNAVNFADLVLLAQNYNTPSNNSDIDGDGMVNFNDLVLLAQNYNTSAPAPAPDLSFAADLGSRSTVSPGIFAQPLPSPLPASRPKRVSPPLLRITRV